MSASNSALLPWLWRNRFCIVTRSDSLGDFSVAENSFTHCMPYDYNEKACSQALYVLFKVRQIRIKTGGIYWPPEQEHTG